MNLENLYTTRIQKTYDEDQVGILSILQANRGGTVKLINYYLGLPLSYPATIVAVERGTVDFDVKSEQAFIIDLNRATFIRSPLFTHDVFASVQYINVKKQAASFIDFSYVEIMAERRNFIRMSLNPSPEVTVVSGFGTYSGHLDDLSLSGVSIRTQTYSPLALDSEATIRFTLSGGGYSPDSDIKVSATLVALKDEAVPYRYVYSIYPDKSHERLLSQFIFRRQIEIIKEIKNAV